MYNCVRGMSAYFLSMFPQINEIESHGKRTLKNKIYVNKLATLRNLLNENIKNSDLSEFKRLLKNELGICVLASTYSRI